MRDLGRRIGAVEERLAPEDDEPRELRVEWSERTFASPAALHAWTLARERANRQRAREGASPTRIRIAVVSLCRPGEQPSERDLATLPVRGRPS
jgi:hypothetical protein